MSKGDQVYAVFVRDGKLLLIGKMQVGRWTSSWKEAVDLVGRNVYRGVPGAMYLIAEQATRMHFSKPLRLRVVTRLRFISNKSPKPKFVNREKLDGQTLRTVRELTPKSAALLDTFLEAMEPVELDT